jgi:hypothetical protein
LLDFAAFHSDFGLATPALTPAAHLFHRCSHGNGCEFGFEGSSMTTSIGPLIRVCLGIWAFSIGFAGYSADKAFAKRAIPDDNLAYPVLLKFKDGSSGSGFYLETIESLFLVTAKHVIFDPKTNKLQSSLDALSYPKEPKESGRNLISIDLEAVQKTRGIRVSQSEDVVAIKIGGVVTNSSTSDDKSASSSNPNPATPANISPPQDVLGTQPLKKAIAFLPGVTPKEVATSGFLAVSTDTIKQFDDVLVGNEVIMFGYPQRH